MFDFDFRRKRRLTGRYAEEINPTDSVMNIADVMLVFACGLMLSIVMFWNVDIRQEFLNIEQGDSVTEINEIRENITESESSGTGYEKMGTVFKDPNTGQLYMLTE